MRDTFGHRLPLDKIRGGERIDLVADDAEREAIAERLGLSSLERLEANVTFERDGPRIRALGRVRAALEQCCIATDEPVAEHVDEPFEVIFLPEPNPDSTEEEIELAEEDCDVVFYDGATVDLGTAVADSLALSVDPFPRSAGADAALREAGVLNEEEAGPFAALAKLRKGSDET
ncbi:MAG: YceD family protein [Sphingomicrobium sp.]